MRSLFFLSSFFVCLLSFLEGKETVVSIGAPLSGPCIEGAVGAIQKGVRQKFCCQTGGNVPGFLGPRLFSSFVKEQPGVFPAPLRTETSLSFHWDKEATVWVVLPDGTSLQVEGSELSIPFPTQSGIYFLLTTDPFLGEIAVEVNTHKSLKCKKRLFLEPLLEEKNDFFEAFYVHSLTQEINTHFVEW